MKTQVQSPALYKPGIVGTPITTGLRRWGQKDQKYKVILSFTFKAEDSLDYMRSVKVLAAKPVDMSLVPRTHSGREELTSENCPLISTKMQRYT